ncbi:peptidylprolyl isomerase [Cohnella abietis]|uniref:PpiC domain-containing protein n=1 Tax=Cohnella abietis TaxID=2507935 RepID=A0A3T1D4B0_9BACL|nr:peptidylprolyl isomerase [Cohnella abietis]BBI32952.1 hypothetical protein KCTCHS21_23510 [Cohnella abietis]
MKDKMKGLVVGLLLGSMLTGSMAYAANSKSINVFLRDLKFKLDGTDKPTASASGFTYKDTVYVPVKSVAEVFGKTAVFDEKTGTVSFGTSAIAVYKGGSITQKEFDTYLAAYSFYFSQAIPSDKQLAVKQLIALKLLAAKSEAAFGKEAANVVTTEIKQIKTYFGTEEKFASQLKASKLSEADLKLFIKRQVLISKALSGMIDDKTVKAEYDRQRKADSAAFVTASVRHILIATIDNQTGKSIRTPEEARIRALEVQAKLNDGGDFAALAKEYSDDPGSKDKGGLYADAQLTQFVTEFKKAGAELPLNQISDPVKTDFGYHIMKVDSRVTYTVEQVKDQLIEGLLSQTYQKYVEKDLPALIQSIKLPANS